ncbi:cytochrome c oxidase subunit 3 [Mycolicibacterium pulveris]|uniref:cytochrome c oxidase subunit 3 n=1 Tax=Mycolicibacterium pulveris TaxID=36813 RepID=UPI0013D44C09|nr:cytochrome c oxidase subunit 3 [Mycolicibacterium pulveris]MCV6981653.1 cytochrome c oxidase subunit 3 [Mycolicibacterium pulveris]
MATVLDSVRAFGSRRHPPRVPGEAGTWIFILGDMSIFSGFFVVYLVYRSGDAQLFDSSAAYLQPLFGVINTLLLLSSSLLVVVGIRAVRLGERTLAPGCFIGAILCGVGFSVMKILEYSDKVRHGITPTTNEFWMYFYVLTGLHFFHLLVGIGVLLYLTVKARKVILTAKELAFIEGGACFWHMVDLLWIVLFPLLYFVR